MTKLRVIFMGTPDFAVPSLAALKDRVEIICVVTQPDKPKGRGHKLQPPPVKVFALENNLRVIQPPKVKAPEVVDELQAHNMLDEAVLVSRCGLDDEKIIMDLSAHKSDVLNYLSTIITRRNHD